MQCQNSPWISKKASDLKISAKTPIYEKQSAHEVDPITYQVVFHKLWQIADEQEKNDPENFRLADCHRCTRF